jgi:hypothetical protein
MSDVNVEETVMMEYMESVHAERLVGTLQVAVDGLTKFLNNFPEIAELYGGVALRNELAHILKLPITNAFAIGVQVTEDAHKAKEQAK